ncbi:MAG TPA: hypothetical protein VGB99_01725 [Acidobacteriota bacterium]
MSHFLILTVGAALISMVFGVLGQDSRPAQLRYGLKLFGLFLGLSILAGWLMYTFPV